MPGSPRRLVTACGVIAAAAAVILPPATASAFPAPAYWVSAHGGPAGANASCASAGYTTVQAAVTAAEAYQGQHQNALPVIDVCPGLYAEQVTITTSLVLTRAPVPARQGAATIELPAKVGSDQTAGLSTTNCQATDAANKVPTPQSVIEVCAAKAGGGNTTGVKAAVSDLTVEGNWTSSCYNGSYDILVEGGASLTLTGSTVEKAGLVSPLSGCQGGVGIEIGKTATSQAGHATLSQDTVESYQKNGITVQGDGSTADISHVTVTGAGPTTAIAQNGIELAYGATGSVTGSSVSGNNYTGQNNASSAGILVFGGCGSSLVNHATVNGNRLAGNDIGIGLFNYDPTCSNPASTVTRDTACFNVIRNDHGYPGGKPSADANLTGSSSSPAVGYQAGVEDVGKDDVICENAISGAGYAPLGATSSLPNPPPPAFVRPVDTVSGPATTPDVSGNTYDGRRYQPA